MIHPIATVHVSPSVQLHVGMTICFGEPGVSLIKVIDGKPNFESELSIKVSQIDEVIAALTKARDQGRANDAR